MLREARRFICNFYLIFVLFGVRKVKAAGPHLKYKRSLKIFVSDLLLHLCIF